MRNMYEVYREQAIDSLSQGLDHRAANIEQARECFRNTLRLSSLCVNHANTNSERLYAQSFQAMAWYFLGDAKQAVRIANVVSRTDNDSFFARLVLLFVAIDVRTNHRMADQSGPWWLDIGIALYALGRASQKDQAIVDKAMQVNKAFLAAWRQGNSLLGDLVDMASILVTMVAPLLEDMNRHHDALRIYESVMGQKWMNIASRLSSYDRFRLYNIGASSTGSIAALKQRR